MPGETLVPGATPLFPLSHLISEGSPGLTVSSRDGDSGQRRQGSCPVYPNMSAMLASSHGHTDSVRYPASHGS